MKLMDKKNGKILAIVAEDGDRKLLSDGHWRGPAMLERRFEEVVDGEDSGVAVRAYADTAGGLEVPSGERLDTWSPIDGDSGEDGEGEVDPHAAESGAEGDGDGDSVLEDA